jgi:hypothetical protein
MADSQTLTPRSALKLSLTNAALLSGLYLAFGVFVEVVRRVWNARWAERMSLALEAFPARTLELFGLFDPIRRAWVENKLSGQEVRMIYGGTTVLIIFSIGTIVGLAMWGLASLASTSSK